MLWIPIFVILFVGASIFISVMDAKNESAIRRRDQNRVSERERDRERYQRNNNWRTDYQEKMPEPLAPKSEEQIKAEAKEQTRELKLLVYGVLTAVVVVITLLNSFYIMDDQKVGYTMTFGKPTVIEAPGLRFKAPFITSVKKFDATSQGMAIGYNIENNENVLEESMMITSDFNFVNTDFYVEYRISDPIEYQFGSDNPVGILHNIALASIRNTVGLYTVDEVITTGKAEIQAKVKEQIIEKLQEHATGLTIVNVTIQDAEPPTHEVSTAFKNVENAKQQADSIVNNAKAAEQTKIPAAEAEADQIMKGAEAAKTERINQATQEVAEFLALYEEYMKNPDTVKKQLYFSMMEDILPEMEIIIGSDSKVIYVKNGEVTTP